MLEATVPATAGSEAVQTEQPFTLYSAASAKLPLPTPDWFVTLQDSVLPGQPARFLVGSSEAEARILVEAEAKGESLRREWLTLQAGEQRVLEVPTTAALSEAQLYVHVTQVRDNRLYLHSATVQVATPPAPLVLSIATFRDKLQPGQKETWRVTIHQAAGQPAQAELLATLYDKSLDVFRAHSFSGLEFPRPYYPAGLAWTGRFGVEESNGLFDVEPNDSDVAVLYPHLNWWRYSLGNEESRNDYKLLSKNSRVRFTPPMIKQDVEVIAAGAPAPQALRMSVSSDKVSDTASGENAAEAAAAPPPSTAAPRLI
ncbi:hypothetical protein [Hymenobacter cellulosilyticus]|uniref:Alpha-2-macroglobulin bait region domain-containing protein n=1 Tax=Hymenobacter cellulosilyticus TaxID=2932248 RepID=A0A8T9Q5P3_9BACT|nr:hypothetical protein [Hymenobacter cellulosilyticus]UOQ72292.1 hypothetical protein MUN79_27735 [Hymenobacter cellulosilyticus]